jgi:DNA-directed RNA polymerase subunit RPC12/RpoP
VQIYVCEACGKDLCTKCWNEIKLDEHNNLHVCPQCKNLDFSEYFVLYERMQYHHDELTKLYREAPKVMSKIRQEQLGIKDEEIEEEEVEEEE